MSEFRSQLVAVLVDPYYKDGTGLWNYREEFRYYSTLLKKEVCIPKGFATDFASVPIAPVTYLAFGNRYHMPAGIHDYLCRYRICKRGKADLVFLEAMRLQNAMEIQAMRDAGVDDDEIIDRKAALEGRAQMMFLGVAAYTKSGLWKTEVDQPGFEPIV